MNRVMKTVLGIVGAAVIAAAGYAAGTQMEQKRQAAAAEQKEDVSIIAVVNMDDGVIRGEEHVNYASQLLAYPDTNFVATGLNDARSGIENGSYAAYIIIPESFSTSVTSIENSPQKILLEYAFNPHLDEETRVQAVSDVNDFKVTLNANIAYMYVDAVLKEFHNVQDDSRTILNNDITELELLQNVKASQLIAAVEHTELEMVENDVQPVDLSSYAEQNRLFLTGMSTGYADAVLKGRDDYALIRSTNAEAADAANDFFTLYGTVLAETAVNQANLLETGKINLENTIVLYNRDIAANADIMSLRIAEMIENQRITDENSAQGQLDTVVADVNDKNAEAMSALQTELETSNAEAMEELRTQLETVNMEALTGLQTKWETVYAAIQGFVQGTLNTQIKELVEGYQTYILDKSNSIVRLAYIQGARDALDAVKSELDADKQEQDGRKIRDAVLAVCDVFEKGLEDAEKEEFLTVSGNDIIMTVSGNDFNLTVSGNDPTLPDYEEDTIAVDWENPVDEKGEVIEIPELKGSVSSGDLSDGSNTDSSDNDSGTDDDNGSSTYTVTLVTGDLAGPSAVAELSRAFTELFALEDDKQTISGVIQNDFMNAVSNENLTQMNRLSDSQSAMSQKMSDYEEKVFAFDPIFYLEGANLDTYLSDISGNTEKMMGALTLNNMEYTAYAADVRAAAASNMAELQTALSQANSQTASNVEACIDELTVSRENKNAQNVNMLEGFTKSLTYTRVKSQGNPEVYDYIVNPVMAANRSTMAGVTNQSSGKKGVSLMEVGEIVVGIAILVCAALMAIGILRKRIYQSREEMTHDAEESF